MILTRPDIDSAYPVLAERYRLVNDQWSDVQGHIQTFVQAVFELNATRVIELGVRYGVSTIAWLYALKDRGHLWSCDCSFPTTEPSFQVDLLNPQGDLGVQDHWSFILGYDWWPQVLAALPDYNVDIVFIDTNHVYEETLRELELYEPRVRSGGRIFMHDTNLAETGNAVTPQPPYPVRTAVLEFVEKRNLEVSFTDDSYGLGTIYVR